MKTTPVAQQRTQERYCTDVGTKIMKKLYIYIYIYIRRPPGPSGRAGHPSLPFYTLPSSLLWSLVPLVHSSLFPIVVLSSPCGTFPSSLWSRPLFLVGSARGGGVPKYVFPWGGVESFGPGHTGSLARALLDPQDHPGASQEPPRATQDRIKIPQERSKIPQERPKIP